MSMVNFVPNLANLAVYGAVWIDKMFQPSVCGFDCGKNIEEKLAYYTVLI